MKGYQSDNQELIGFTRLASQGKSEEGAYCAFDLVAAENALRFQQPVPVSDLYSQERPRGFTNYYQGTVAPFTSNDLNQLVSKVAAQLPFDSGALEAWIGRRYTGYVTGLSDTAFLRASHIKPWSDSNNRERLDPHNGLFLSPNYDHLFDHGYITFADDGALLVSNEPPPAIRQLWRIPERFHGVELGPLAKSYLKHHREIVFRARKIGTVERLDLED